MTFLVSLFITCSAMFHYRVVRCASESGVWNSKQIQNDYNMHVHSQFYEHVTIQHILNPHTQLSISTFLYYVVVVIVVNAVILFAAHIWHEYCSQYLSVVSTTVNVFHISCQLRDNTDKLNYVSARPKLFNCPVKVNIL